MFSSHYHKTDAIVINKRNSGESDRKVILLTKEFGKVQATAKGVRKISSRRAGSLEIFHLLNVHLHESTNGYMYISEVLTLRNFVRISKKLPKIAYAYHVCEIVDRLLPERQVHSDIYDLVSAVLNDIESARDIKEMEKKVTEFSFHLMQILGFISADKKMTYGNLLAYIEQITEKKLKTLAFISSVKDPLH